MKQKLTAEVLENKQISADIYDMTLLAPAIAAEAKAGGFVSVYSGDEAHMLPRPISLCGIDREKGTLRLVYRVVGYGTAEFSRCVAGDKLDILGPLGNGFTQENKKAILIGGGIGIPPMLQLAKELHEKGVELSVVLGYREVLFLNEEFEQYGKVYISTEDGSAGTKGNVIDAIKEQGVTGDVIYACGPTPMLRGIKAYAVENEIECQISMEERMACGVGACLACVCNTTEVDHHSQVNNKRICADGPVFNALEVTL